MLGCRKMPSSLLTGGFTPLSCMRGKAGVLPSGGAAEVLPGEDGDAAPADDDVPPSCAAGVVLPSGNTVPSGDTVPSVDAVLSAVAAVRAACAGTGTATVRKTAARRMPRKKAAVVCRRPSFIFYKTIGGRGRLREAGQGSRGGQSGRTGGGATAGLASSPVGRPSGTR